MYNQRTAENNPFDYSSPRPYAWKTDEFQTQTEPRQTVSVDRPNTLTEPLQPGNPNFLPVQSYQHRIGQPFRCPRCMSHFPPRIERRISTAGWIVFAVLLVVFFPLFWIGLLIKEDVPVCQNCNLKID